MRVGIGSDVHPLVEGRRLVLGGVEIEHDRGLVGHSDADVLTHAVIDALLGAAALGDIGQRFPDTDERYRGVSSLILLEAAMALVAARRLRVLNLDSVVLAQRPRLQRHLAEMAANLAGRLRLEVGQVSVKASAPEGLGALGRAEGIAAQAIVLLEEVT